MGLILIGLILTGASACGTKPDAAPPNEGAAPPPRPAREVLSLLSHGDGEETLVTTVSGRESFTCTTAQADGPREWPCRRFTVVPRRPGTLVVKLAWDNGHPLLLALQTVDGVPVGTACCRSPQRLTRDVEAASTFELHVMLMTAWGQDEHQPFELTASLEF